MTVRRFFKKCEDFSICGAIADEGDYVVEDNSTIFQILVKGSGRVGVPFSDESTPLNSKDILFDIKKYRGKYKIYQSYDTSHCIGFNSLKPEIDWDAQLITESFVGNDMSYLICFDGNPTVNGKQMQRWDYAKLSDKEYSVDNDGILVMFTRK